MYRGAWQTIVHRVAESDQLSDTLPSALLAESRLVRSQEVEGKVERYHPWLSLISPSVFSALAILELKSNRKNKKNKKK